MMEKWVGEIVDIEACFREIDVNGGGFVLFDEFCEWAIKKSLDLDDDEEVEGADFEGMLAQKDDHLRQASSSNGQESGK